MGSELPGLAGLARFTELTGLKCVVPFIFLFFLACQEQTKTTAGKSTTADSITAVDEKSLIELGGEKQYVEITGTSTDNPVLLFLHGGPGWPQTPYLRYYNSELSKSMTLVAWEQSGAGKSYMNNPNPGKLSLEQLIKDGHELTQILKKKFKKDKIYLAGYSWGSIIGLKLAELYPEDYEAYIGISQALNTSESVKVSREWIRKQAASKNDNATLKTLNQIEKGDTSICKGPLDCFIKQHELLSKYGGAIFKKETEVENAKAETKYEDYKKYDWLAGFQYSANRLENDLFGTDLTSIKEIKIPVYFFLGRHDWTLPASLSEKFLDKLTCPKKEIVWFENSAHEPLEEEAALFNQKLSERVTK